MKLRLEIPLTLFVFALVLADSVTMNWIIYRTCYVTMGFNKSVCALLGSNHSDNATQEIEAKVQPHVTILSMTKSLIEAYFPIIVCFFIGPWSDKYGRKPVFLLAFGGFTLAYAIQAVISVIPNISPWYSLCYTIPLCISGGFMTVASASLCYITDITLPEARGIRMSIFYAVIMIGSLIGSTASSFALHIFGYFVTYVIASSCIFLAWLLTFLFLPESVSNLQTEDKLKNLFKTSLVRETIETSFRSRENYKRILLFIITFILVFHLLAGTTDNITFLYLRKKFHWSLERYTLYNGLNIVAGTVGSVLGIYILHKLLRVQEPVIMVIGFASASGGAVVKGLATKNWHIYAAGAVRSFDGVIGPMGRSLISNLVPSDEYGKIFSFVAICESIISPLGAPLYTYIYNNTLSVFPGTFSLVSAGLNGLEIIICLTFIALQKKQNVERNGYQSIDT